MELRALFQILLGPERKYYWLAIAYGVAMSLLTLAVPLSVQILINSIANTALMRPLVVLGIALFALLGLYGFLYALQTWVMDRFERHFFARVSQEIILRSLHARFAAVESVNREELANRFFEIVTVQRNLPAIVIGGSRLFLQSLAGFIVVSAYHPVFLAFNAVLIAAVWLVWRIWGGRAIRSKIKASKAKFRLAHWLEELARDNAFFKSERAVNFAVGRSDRFIDDYLGAHRTHFLHKFWQLIVCLFLYALASAALLVMGGWLVINSALSLGQLVAAELILSVIFIAIARMPDYLDLWYELCAGIEKLGDFYAIPLEAPVKGERLAAEDQGLRFDQVVCRFHRDTFRYDFALAPGSQVMVVTSAQRLQKSLIDLLQRHLAPEAGTLSLGDRNLADINPHHLRDAIALVDNSGALESSIADNLALGDATVDRSAMRAVLEEVDLHEEVSQLADGLDTVLGPFGYPLSRSETIRMKIAAALLTEPRVLILTEVFDSLSLRHRRRILQAIRRRPSLVLLDFSTRRDIDSYTGYLVVRPDHQELLPSLSALLACEQDVPATEKSREKV